MKKPKHAKNQRLSEAREKVIEEYENKLNDLTLEIFEKQTRLEEIELSLERRERRIKIKENNLSLTVFDNVFHLSVVILVGYATTRIFLDYSTFFMIVFLFYY